MLTSLPLLGKVADVIGAEQQREFVDDVPHESKPPMFVFIYLFIL